MKHLKQEFDTLTIKEMLTYLLAFVMMVSAIVLVYLGLYLEPKGEIHPSVLTYFGLACASCSIFLGISAHYGNELARFKSQVMEVMRQMGMPAETISAIMERNPDKAVDGTTPTNVFSKDSINLNK